MALAVCDHVWQVGGSGLSAAGDAAIYLLVFGDRAALIDAGCGQGHDRVLKHIAEALPPAAQVEYLFLTHCHYDHVGGAEALRRHFACAVVAHELDACFLERGDSTVTAADWYNAALDPLSVDRKLSSSREDFQVGSGMLQALHWPGHSPGSLVLLTEIAGSRVLFGQDVHGPLHPALLSSRDDYITSLGMLQNLEADILCEGHFGIIRGKARIREFIQSFMK
jgi:glyoxylase-like metal-dependent hydrolase (beta-lactamase superfamily II)